MKKDAPDSHDNSLTNALFRQANLPGRLAEYMTHLGRRGLSLAMDRHPLPAPLRDNGLADLVEQANPAEQKRLLDALNPVRRERVRSLLGAPDRPEPDQIRAEAVFLALRRSLEAWPQLQKQEELPWCPDLQHSPSMLDRLAHDAEQIQGDMPPLTAQAIFWNGCAHVRHRANYWFAEVPPIMLQAMQRHGWCLEAVRLFLSDRPDKILKHELQQLLERADQALTRGFKFLGQAIPMFAEQTDPARLKQNLADLLAQAGHPSSLRSDASHPPSAPTPETSLPDLADWLLSMAKKRETEGLLALEPPIQHIQDPWLAQCLELLVMGTDAATLQAMACAYARSARHQRLGCVHLAVDILPLLRLPGRHLAQIQLLLTMHDPLCLAHEDMLRAWPN